MTLAIAARGTAVAIALAAAIDPAWTRSRPVPVPVSIVHDGRSETFAARVRDALAPDFRATTGADPDRQAAVIIRGTGEDLPAPPEDGRVFVIDDPTRSGPLRIRSFEVPARTAPGRSVTAVVYIDMEEPDAGDLNVRLRVNGQLVASESRPVDEQPGVRMDLRFVPPASGLVPVDVEVTSGSARAAAGAALHVVDRTLRVAFVDPRPAWASTFVRRALEEDPAFDVSSQTTTSRGVAATAGPLPSFADRRGAESCDAIVVSTPSALPAGMLADLEAFVRDRGGSLVLLADSDAPAVLQRLTGIGGWRTQTLNAPVDAASSHGPLLVRTAMLLSATPAAVSTLATLGDERAPLVIDVPAGAGRIVISGALDAWRYRGTVGSAFAAFWRGVIGDAAVAAAPPISIELSRTRLNPGEAAAAEVVIRGAHAQANIQIEGEIEHAGGADAVRLWPSVSPGTFVAQLAAPGREGHAQLKIRASVDGRNVSAAAPLLVLRSAPLADAPLEAAPLLASTHGGAYIPNGDLERLQRALREAFPAHHAPATTHPMRYVWWLVPFTLALGYEWRWRRQRGLK